MRKIILAAALALGLSGCAQVQQLYQLEQASVVGVNNPITKETLNNMESAMTIAFAGLQVYKDSCVKGIIPDSCKAVIRKIQAYTVLIPPYLAQLRVFVKNNDQVNAKVVYNTIMALVLQLKSDAAMAGIKVGG